jgi:hypothetical protein
MAVSGDTSGATGTIVDVHLAQSYEPTGTYDEEGFEIYAWVQYADWIRVKVSSGTFQAEDITIDSGTYAATVSAVGAPLASVAGITLSPRRKTWTWSVPSGQYDVRIKRVTADDHYTNRAGDTVDACYWTAIRSIEHGKAVIADDVTLVALRVKASGQLNGVIDQYNCVAKALIERYDNTGWNLVHSRNPAWAFCEVLRGASNARALDASRINLTKIRAWASSCNTAGRTFDCVIDFRTTVWEILRMIATVGRAAPGLIDNQYTVVEDTTQ